MNKIILYITTNLLSMEYSYNAFREENLSRHLMLLKCNTFTVFVVRHTTVMRTPTL